MEMLDRYLPAGQDAGRAAACEPAPDVPRGTEPAAPAGQAAPPFDVEGLLSAGGWTGNLRRA